MIMQKIHPRKEIKDLKVHIMVLEKFIPNFLKHAKKYLNFDNHIFLIFMDEKCLIQFPIDKEVIKSKNIIFVNNKYFGKYNKYYHIFRYLLYAKKIFLHGLWIKNINILLMIGFWNLKKCHWLIWGGDLYKYESNSNYSIDEIIRKFIIKRFGFITPVVRGDFLLAQKVYKTTAKCVSEIFYMQFYEKYEDLIDYRIKNNNKVVVQIGNSATQSNNHKAVIDILSNYQNKLEVILPLSYGDLDYGKEISTLAKSRFSGVEILRDFLPLTKYNSILQKVDIAVFATKRQQAMGNIFVLLFLGKKVYLEKGYSHYEFLENKGFKIFDINDFNIDKLSIEDAIYNKNLVLEYYSKDKQIKNFEFIFDS